MGCVEVLDAVDGLARADLSLADGTFKVVPNIFFQLYSIHFDFFHVTVPRLEFFRRTPRSLQPGCDVNILHRLVVIPTTPYLLPASYDTHGHSSKFLVPSTRVNAFRYSYFPATISMFYCVFNVVRFEP